ncbi:MAG: hypothetical protein CML40_02860 [Rhodobacteraceae bacterium]|nr:MAG: hypothetical protein CML40_02860 [Paracoccaceae bacterium]
MKKIFKKKIFYFFLLVEEGVAYYLTFKWPLVLLACVISIFPTILISWIVKMFLNSGISWELIFFLIWLKVLIIFLIEFPLPEYIKDRVKKKLSDLI